MINLHVELKERSYPILISSNYDKFSEFLKVDDANTKLIIITDSNVFNFQYMEFIDALNTKNHTIYKYIIDAGEKSKSFDTVKDIYSFLLNLKVDRTDILIALGGGVVGDIVGFVASTYLRGISFIQVPTTLLAQVDSSVGGKVGINFNNKKNIIGSFYQPKFVYINLNSLSTLPIREFRSGLAEIIVHCIIGDRCLFEYIENNFQYIFEHDLAILEHVISENCAIKISVVEQDERDNGVRAILNFGHTIGHAIESVNNFKLSHGECVAIGSVGAFRLAQYMGLVDDVEVDRVINLLERVGLPYYLINLDIEQVFNQMHYDKKSDNGILVFILPNQIGKADKYYVENENLIKKVLNDLKRRL